MEPQNTEPQIIFEKPLRGIANKQEWNDTYNYGTLSTAAISTSRDTKQIPFELFARSSDGQEIHFKGKTPDSKRFEEAVIDYLTIAKENFKLYPPLKVNISADGFLENASSFALKKLVTEKPIAEQSLSELISSSKTRLIPANKEPLSFIEIAQNTLDTLVNPSSTPNIFNNKIKQR